MNTGEGIPDQRRLDPLPKRSGDVFAGPILSVVAALSLGFMSYGILVSFGSISLGDLSLARIDLSAPIAGVTGALFFSILGILWNQRALGMLARRALTLSLVVSATGLCTPEAFTLGIPQVLWAPTLVAVAITSLGWTVMVFMTTAATVILQHGIDTGAFTNPGVGIISLSLLVLLLSIRHLYDKQLHLEMENSRKAYRLAFEDPLTGLLNRRLLTNRIEEAIKKAERSSGGFAILFGDLDDFGALNKAVGHSKADEVLKKFGSHLKSIVRETDSIARFGGDEFVVLLDDCTSTEAVDRIADSIRAGCKSVSDSESLPFSMSASLGVGIYPVDGKTPEELLESADKALGEAKSTGKDKTYFYSQALQGNYDKRLSLQKRLREDMSQGERLRVVYQPIVRLRDNRVIGAEVLSRWNHPDYGDISPATFIPLAERLGLIEDLAESVVDHAAKASHTLRSHEPDFFLSVNCSPVHFQTRKWGPQSNLTHLFSRKDLPPGALSIEVKEQVLREEGSSVKDRLFALKDEGVGLSLDDFGQEASSLSHLLGYGMDTVKVDRQFVTGLKFGTLEYRLCRNIISTAHDLGLQVIAEGVETKEQLSILQGLGCDFAQGFYLDHPMEIEALEDKIRVQTAA